MDPKPLSEGDLPELDGPPAGTANVPVAAESDSSVYRIPVQVMAVIGKAVLQVSELMKLGRGAVIELDTKVGGPIDIYVNNRRIARAELIVNDDRLSVSMTEVLKVQDS